MCYSVLGMHLQIVHSDSLRDVTCLACLMSHLRPEWWVDTMDLLQKTHFDSMLIHIPTILIVKFDFGGNGVSIQQLLVLFEKGDYVPYEEWVGQQ